jgi:hypothetical protein
MIEVVLSPDPTRPWRWRPSPQSTIQDLQAEVSLVSSLPSDAIAVFLDRNLLVPWVKLHDVLANSTPALTLFVDFASMEGTLRPAPLLMHAVSPARPVVPAQIGVKILHGRIMNCPIDLLIDSGAVTSILFINLVEPVPGLKAKIDSDPKYRVSYKAVEGVTSPALGCLCSIRLDLTHIVTYVNFTVLDERSEYGLLGLDWMKQNNVQFEALQDRIVINGRRLALA